MSEIVAFDSESAARIASSVKWAEGRRQSPAGGELRRTAADDWAWLRVVGAPGEGGRQPAVVIDCIRGVFGERTSAVPVLFVEVNGVKVPAGKRGPDPLGGRHVRAAPRRLDPQAEGPRQPGGGRGRPHPARPRQPRLAR